MYIYDELTPERELEIIEKVAKFIVRTGMTEAAVLFFQSFKSLAWLGGNYALLFVEPFIPVYEKESREIINALGQIKNVKLLIERMEELHKEQKEIERSRRDEEGETQNKLFRYLGIMKKKILGRSDQE